MSDNRKKIKRKNQNDMDNLHNLENCYQQLLNLFRENGVDKIQGLLEHNITDETLILYTFDQAVDLLQDIRLRQDFENYLKNFRRTLKTASSQSAATPYKALSGRFGKILKGLKMRQEIVPPDPD